MWVGRRLWGSRLGLALAVLLPACSGSPGNPRDAGPDGATALTIRRSINAIALIEGGVGQRVGFHIDGPLAAPVVVSLTLANPALATVEPAQLTFQPSNAGMPQQVLVTAVHDDDGAGGFTTLSATAPGARGADVGVDILDNDDQQVLVSPRSLTIAEGQTGTVQLRLALRPGGDLGITLTPSQGDKLTLTPGTVRFTAASFSTPVPITLEALPDADARDDTITVEVVVDALGRVVATFQVTILDDDVTPARTIAATRSAVSLSEGGAAQSVGIFLQEPITAPLVVDLRVADPTAAAVVPSQLTFTPADFGVAQQVAVTAIPDDDTTPSSTTLVSTAPGATPATVSVQILDDDSQQLLVSPTSPPYVRLDEGGSATFQLALAFRPATDLSVTVTPNLPGELAIAPNPVIIPRASYSTPVLITLSAPEDADLDNEGVTLTLASPGNAPDASLLVLLQDNDNALLVSPTTLRIVEGGLGAMVGVRLQNPLATTTTVNLVVTDPLMASVSPAQLVFTPDNWPTTQYVMVRADRDDDAAPEQTTLTASAPGMPSRAVAIAIDDQDDQGILANPTAFSIREGQSGTFSLRLALRQQPDATIAVTSPDPRLVAAPTTVLYTMALYPAWVPITLTALDDADTVNDTFVVALTSPSLASDTTLNVTVIDDD